MDLKDNEAIRLLPRIAHPEDLSGLFRVIIDLPRQDLTVLVKIDGPLRPAEQRGGRRRLLQTRNPRKKPRPPLCGELIWHDRKDLQSREKLSLLQRVQVKRDSAHYEATHETSPDGSQSATKRQAYRSQVMAPFLDREHLKESIQVHHGLSGLVKEVMEKEAVSASLVYQLWSSMCRGGLDADSLLPRYHQCGAPGVRRPCAPDGRKKAGRKTLAKRIEDAYPDHVTTTSAADQDGMTDAWRAAILAADSQIPTPKPRMANRYDAIILMGFVREWKQDGATLVPILPAMGQMPNRRQVRWVLTSEYTRLERLRQHTTAGHYLRSLRGLRGRSWEGVPGPGHTFAIDCTRGDIFLRSSVNRSWIIGRPIVYVVVDVWSTAVVGFYVCLEGPSWDTARVAIFNSSADPMLIGQLWTYDPWITLTPSPCAPYAILADRGEILSEAAAKAMFHLVPRVDYAAPYRPDMKGIVEVLIRIAKDMAYQGFVPGAIDARRAEFELRRSKPELSALTLREFVRWLHIMFATYNLTADRRSRLDAYMIGAGVVPSPAGLWRYGHKLGIGYRTHTEADDLIARLLPAATGRTVAHGIDFDGALYETNVTGLGSVTAEARNFGVSEVPLHFYPGALSRIWTPRGASTGLNCLRLADTSQPADLTWYEHWDARAYATLENARWEHDRTATRVKARALNDAIVTGAKHATAEADEKMQSPRPSVQDARLAEMTGQRPATTADQAAIAEAGRSPVSPPTTPRDAPRDTPRDTPPTGDALQWYLEAMRSMADATDGSDAP